jgi:hypothetical protein
MLRLDNQPSRFTAWRLFVSPDIEEHHRASPLFELALVLMRVNHIARIIVNANHSVM